MTGNESMAEIEARIEEKHPGTIVYNVNRFGGWSSLDNMWYQVEQIGNDLVNISNKHPDGIHLLGYSQGALIARVIVQAFPTLNVCNLISLSGPQAGQYGTAFLHIIFPNLALKTAYELFYSYVGQHTSVGNYWNDPYHQDLYYKYSHFLPYTNNALLSNRSVEFKSGIVKLNKFVLIGGPDDNVITPWQSSHFGYYNENVTVIDMKDRDIYTKDLIGLKTLDEAKKLDLITVPGKNILAFCFKTLIHCRKGSEENILFINKEIVVEMDPSLIAANTNFSQNIRFKGSDSEYSAAIVAQDVTVNCSAGTHDDGSSKVKLTNLVEYQWEFKYYIGQLIAIHIDGKIIAYGIKGKMGSMLKVARISDANDRILIKDIKGLVQDVSFALTSFQIILGVVDEAGNLFVYNIEDKKTIKATLLLHVIHPIGRPNTNYRVIWCPYVPSCDENPDTIDDPAKLLVLLNGSRAEVWDVSIVNAKYGNTPIQPREEHNGFVEISGHSMDIIDASFSPDGTAIATASLDGYVKFFQVYMLENEKPRCLHQWKPHEGKALSCLLFLDNVNTYGTDSKFWKFAITGANHNAELKIWSCETWTCVQTIRFVANPNSPCPEMFLKVRIDLTASFILLSDINNRILYVLQILKNEEERLASAVIISEFLLPAPFMSFCIANATTSKFKFSNSTEEIYREDGDDYDEDSNTSTINIKLYTVQPKRLQECNITFQLESSLTSNSNSSYKNILEQTDAIEATTASSFKDAQEETDREDNEITKLDDLQSSVTLLIQQQQNSQPLNLMTPADFNSPVVVNSSPNERLRNSLANEVGSPQSALRKSIEKLPETVENLIDFQQPQKDNFASGGSSPSREVQEILAFNNPSYNPQEYFDNLSKVADDSTFDQVEDESKSNEVVWPNISTMKAIEIQMKEENRRKEQMQLPQEDQETTEANWNKAQIQALNYRITGLESLIREQNSEIQKLHHYFKSHRNNPTPEYDIRTIISNELEIAFDKNQTHMIKMLENANKEQKRKDWEQLEVVVTNVMKNLLQKISDSLQEIISREIKTTVLPPVMANFDTLLHQLDIHYSQKINTIDQLLKTNISKLVSSKAVTESLSMSIISVIKPSLEECYKDMISTTLIPSWEKVCNSMFLQIHNTFTQGTKEYTSSVESYMDRQRRVQDKGKDLITQMQTVSEGMKNNTEKLSSHLSTEIQRQFNLAFNNMQEALKHTIAEHVKEQVKIGFKLHASVLEDSVVNAVRSRAVTPSPHVIDTQVQLAQIQALLAKGNIDVAFQQALSASASASDLSLVLHVCEKVNPLEVFNQGTCLLQQHVLLSLVQQLGADLSHHTDIKLRYLEEAILNLDPKNSVTREHLPVVLRELSRQLAQFIANNPTNKHTKNMRMLQMAIQSVLKT
ncbi:WD40 region of Ge1, enhancer of mRNA-decapping protein [Popillia japonica]|uniref:WD40 region of Ge1, enhancer of mRNA-decapping protein n=2 Tax=Popillia japonica TaxID=7064 RepID=A0AAW1JDY7_POPJA